MSLLAVVAYTSVYGTGVALIEQSRQFTLNGFHINRVKVRPVLQLLTGGVHVLQKKNHRDIPPRTAQTMIIGPKLLPVHEHELSFCLVCTTTIPNRIIF